MQGLSARPLLSLSRVHFNGLIASTHLPLFMSLMSLGKVSYCTGQLEKGASRSRGPDTMAMPEMIGEGKRQKRKKTVNPVDAASEQSSKQRRLFLMLLLLLLLLLVVRP